MDDKRRPRDEVGTTLVTGRGTPAGLYGVVQLDATDLVPGAYQQSRDLRGDLEVLSADLRPIRPTYVSPMHLAADGRPLVAARYIIQDGRLLIVRRRLRDGAPEWTGPTGNVEPGEMPEEAAVER